VLQPTTRRQRAGVGGRIEAFDQAEVGFGGAHDIANADGLGLGQQPQATATPPGGFEQALSGEVVDDLHQVVLRQPMLFGELGAALLWHAHEMLFGFAAAVITGFLLTAGKAWTGLATPRGAFLGALAALWLAARIAAIVGPYPLYAGLDLVLLPVVAAVLGDVLLRGRSRRNLLLVGILLLLSLSNLCFHLALLGVLHIEPMQALHAALALIVMIECVMVGRLLPAFTVNASPVLIRLKAWPRLERATLALTAVALLAWVFQAPAGFTAIVFGTAAAAHLARQWTWRPALTRGRPILWILHAAYVWLPLGFVLLAGAQLGWVAASAGVHALAVGTTGGLIVGMITRTARGHTGRPLQASRLEVQPLRDQFEDRAFGQFEWTALEAGPDVWRIQITRGTQAAVPSAGPKGDSCCSGGACCG
jgi:uncharacterized protein involved in response to NO